MSLVLCRHTDGIYQRVDESVRRLKLVADRGFPGWREEAPIHPLKGNTVERPGTDRQGNNS